MTQFKNLTPHAINLVTPTAGQGITIPASGLIARCAIETKAGDPILFDGLSIEVVTNRFGAVQGLPDPEQGVILLVSALVGTALAGKRDDLYGPDTTPDSVIRDAEGKIVGVRRLQKF